MCSIIIVNHHLKDFPLIIAANRDEDIERKSSSVSILSKEPHLILGGKDEKFGGSWLAVNSHSLFAAITNQGECNKKLESSRGNIIVDILKCKTIDDMIQFAKNINLSKYNSFNLIFGNNQSVFLAHSYILKSLVIRKLSKGINLITSDMMFYRDSDLSHKSEYIHKKLDHLKNASWLEYYKVIKTTLGSVDNGMRVKARKRSGKLYGHCTVSSSVLAFSDSGLARYKFYDRTIERQERQEGDTFIPRYKDYIDIWRNPDKTIEPSSSEDSIDDDTEANESAFAEKIKFFKNRFTY